jgi:hypothetical protein
MQKTRQSVFETNSSSSHSITISNNRESLARPPGDDTITLTGGQFGWGVDYYYDFLTKANYVAQDQASCPENLALLQRVISDFTGRIVNIDEEVLGRGYVDHQSVGTSSELFDADWDNDHTKLRAFLFSPHSELCIDNDNH